MGTKAAISLRKNLSVSKTFDGDHAAFDKALLAVYLAAFDGFAIYWREASRLAGGLHKAKLVYACLEDLGLCADPYLVNDEEIPEGPVLQCFQTYDSISRAQALELFYKKTGLTPENSVAVQAIETPLEYAIRVTWAL